MDRQTIEKIFSSKENIYKFIDSILTPAVIERCNKYGKSYSQNLEKVVKLTIQYLTDRQLGAEFIEHSFSQILSICNKTGSWDHKNSVVRNITGIEEILLIIEPAEEFARLHDKSLASLDECYLDQFNLRQYL